MALPFVYVTRRDLARGIDTLSPKTALPDGFAEDLVNLDTNLGGKLETRKGYEGVNGWLPIRVQAAEHTGTSIILTLPSGMDISSLPTSALVVSGLLSSNASGPPAGDFTRTTSQAHWYPTWTLQSQVTLTAPSGTASVTASVHSRTSTDFWPILFTGTAGYSATPLTMDSTEIDTTTFDIDFDYTVGVTEVATPMYVDVPATAGSVSQHSVTQNTPQTVTFSGVTCTDVAHGLNAEDVVVFATSGTLPAELTAGTLYRIKTVPTADTFTVSALDSDTTITTTSGGSGTHTWEQRGWAVTAATHNLTTQEILVKCWDSTANAGKATEVTPAGYYVLMNGTVVVYFEADFTGEFHFVSVPAAQYSAQTASGAGTFTYSSIDIGTFNYVVHQALRYNATMSRWEAIEVDYYTVDVDDHLLEVRLTAGAAESHKLCWAEAVLAGNRLAVTDRGAVSETWSDTAPQLTVWGLGHRNDYVSDSSRQGHVNHLDVYRRAGESTLVAGLGGNLFTSSAAGSGAEFGDQLVALKFTPNLSADHVVGRAFYNATPGPAPSNSAYFVNPGYVDADGAMSVTAVTYDAASHGWTLTVPVATESGTLNPAWVYLSGFPHAVLSGWFRVIATADPSATYRTVTVGVPPSNAYTATELARFDLATCSGLMTSNVGQFPIESTDLEEVPAPGDVLSVPGISTTETWTVLGVLDSSNTVHASGVVAPVTIPAGTSVGVTRTTATLVLEDTDGNVTAEGFVPGDQVSVTGYDNRPRVLWVFDSLAADSVAATYTSADTVTWPSVNLPPVGAKVWLSVHGTVNVALGAQSYNVEVDQSGAYEVESLNTGTLAVTFTEDLMPEGATGTLTVTVPYGQVSLDQDVTASEIGGSRTAVAVTGRWQPIEAVAQAASANSLGAETWYRHLSSNAYIDQVPVHSTTLADAMYLTQGDDPVYKFDGSNLYQAGQPSWPLGLFARVNTTTSSLAVGQTVAFSGSSATDKTFTTTYTSVEAGDRLYDAATPAGPFTVVAVEPDSSSTYKIRVRAADNISTAVTPLNIVQQYRYYVKLTSVDVNGYVTPGAARCSGDLVVDLTAAGQIELRLVPPPAFGARDWARVELEVYRTKANGASYFRVHRQVVSWDPELPYLTFTDGTPDDLLVSPDTVGTALSASLQGYDGSTVPGLLTAVEAPPRGAVVTTLDNRLVLGNLVGWPESKLNLLPLTTATSITAANLSGARFLFRRDSADTATTTSMPDRVAYEFVSPASTTFTFDAATDLDDATETITKAGHGLVTGESFRLTGTLPTGLSLATTYYAIVASSNTFKVASSVANAHAGTAINLTDNAGTCTLTGYDGVGIVPDDITATTSTFVVASDGHGLVAGDWVYLYHSSYTATDSNRLAGWWRVASATTDTFTVAFTNDGTVGTAVDCDRWVKASTSTDVPVLLASDYNYGQRDGNPSSDSWQLQAPWRLANAINASMRAATADTGGVSGFTPWLSAFGGADQPLGQLVVRCPNAEATTPEVVAPSSLAGFRLYVNDVQKSASVQTAFETGLWPSRLVRSFRNYPEVFDAPYAPDQGTSDAVIDVNPADGQDIVAIIPMFGESATGSQSQLSQDLLVFKTSSVYVVNVETRDVQRLNTRGQGCSSARSVAYTQEGVVFANSSGVYRINRDKSMSTIGRNLTGLWRDNVNTTALAEACATHYSNGRRYKLAVPYTGDSYASKVLVYDYDREGQGQEFGAWTRYTNHTPVWWANDDTEAYWASQTGDVYKIRRLGDTTDYRDDADAVAEQVALLRAEDFDLPGVRKAIRYVAVTVETSATALTDLVVKTAPNLSQTYTEGGRVSFTLAQGRHHVFHVPPPSRRATHVQVRLSHSTTDEALVLTGLMYEVAQLSSKLVPDSGDA